MKNMHKIRGKREFLFDDRELFVLGSGAVIICGLIFILGFLVGQGIQQNTLAQTMAAQTGGFEEPLLTDTEPVSNTDALPGLDVQEPIQEASPDKKSQSSYFTVLPDREEYVEVEATPVKQASPPETPEEEQTPDPATGELPTENPEQAPVAQALDSASTTAMRQNTVVAPVLPNVPRSPTDEMHVGRPTAGLDENIALNGPLYSVQVASSPSRDDSERLQQKFIGLGYESSVMTANLGERGIWYRVRVGNLPTKEDAEALRQDILNRASHLAKEPYVIKVTE
jgi:cell division protein FtsN